MGKWISKKNLKARARHKCEPPLTWFNYRPKGGLESVWQCDCGKKWEVKQNVIAYYPSKPEMPVLTWGTYGKKDFGLKSALPNDKKKKKNK